MRLDISKIKKMTIDEIQETLSNVIKTIVESIIEIFRKVEFEQTRKIYVSKWI